MRTFPLLAIVVAIAACSKEPAAPASPETAPSPMADTSAPAAAAPAADPAAPPTDPAAPAAPAAPATPGSVVGVAAPDFTLTDLDGKQVSLASTKGKLVVLEWFNPKCPYVQRSHTKGSLVDTAKRHTAKGVVWLVINSGAPGKQGHEVGENQDARKTWRLGHPILRDIDGKVGKAYGATNTPHMFVIDTKGTVVYAGAIDNSPDAEGKSPDGGTLVDYVDAAIADVQAGRPVKTSTTKAYGCSVKYGS